MTTSRLTSVLGIDHPILLGAFGGLSSVDLTAAVSNRGGLGQYGLYGYTAERIRTTVDEIRAATDRPFALNLWLPTGDEVTPLDIDQAATLSPVEPIYDELFINPPELQAHFLPEIGEQLDAVLEARPAVLSVVYGVPDTATVEAAHSRGIRVVGTATTVAEARALAAGGVDAVIASGVEAAGHRVSFLKSAEESLVGGVALWPQVVDAVDVPVIAAGGIAERRGVAAAFALGVDGILAGTAFLATRESVALDAHKAAIRASHDDTTVLTRAMTGRLSRGIPNRAIRAIEAAGAPAPFPAQSWATGAFRAEAGRRGNAELVSLWAGQAAPLARYETAAEVFDELVRGVAPIRGAD